MSTTLTEEEKKELDPHRLLTVKEVAYMLRCSESYLRKLCRDGKIEFIRSGRNYTFEMKHVEDYKRNYRKEIEN